MRIIFLVLAWLACEFAFSVTGVRADAGPRLSVGVIGDSFSDEYLLYPPHRSHARNWAELLHGLRRVDFGPFGAKRREAPQSKGFLYNLAKDGLSAAQAAQLGYADAMAAYVAAGKVDAVLIFIGGNDFVDAVTGDADIDYAQLGADTLAAIQSMVATIEAAPGDAPIIVATLPDPGLLPVVAALNSTGLLSDGDLAALRASVETLDDTLKTSYQDDPRVRIADLTGPTATLLGHGQFVRIGGRRIDLIDAADDPYHLFLADGLHLGTIGQALIANVFLRALNQGRETKIRGFSGSQMLQAAQRVSAIK